MAESGGVRLPLEVEITKNGPVRPKEIEDLREAVGWDRGDGVYDTILKMHYAYYTVRLGVGDLVGYISVLSDGVSDALLLDLMIHPQAQRQGIGIRLVRYAIQDLKRAGIRCVQVTFDERLKRFYEKCGFHVFSGGIIDFQHMQVPGAADPQGRV